ncbi:MAG: ABC transporter permease [Bacillota bacterium]
MTLLIGSIELGLLYGILALGVYITFRILNIPDLTVEGSFVLGMATTAVFTQSGNPVMGLVAAIIAGAVAGICTGLLQTKLMINPILSGIIVMTGLYTINLAVMGGKANMSILGNETVFSMLENRTILALIIAASMAAILGVFFKTRTGLAIRGTGDNEEMVRASSINSDTTKCMALAMGNGLVALSGGLIAQYQLFSDVGSGTGIVVIGLASVIIGEVLLGKRGVTFGLFTAIGGSIIYRIIIAFALKVDLFPPYSLKLISAIVVMAALSGPYLRKTYRGKSRDMKRKSSLEQAREFVR